MTPYRIILADDHTLFRQGIRRIIEEDRNLKIIGEAEDGLKLLKILNRSDPDMIILDITMPNLRGIEATKKIKTIRQEVKILILTMHRDTAYFRHAISAGVDGYLLKEDADTELFSAINTIRQGKAYVSPILLKELSDDLIGFIKESPYQPSDPLTKREREILKLITEGKSSREIGTFLNISNRTVQNHRANMMKKLDLNNTADLIKYAIRNDYTSSLS